MRYVNHHGLGGAKREWARGCNGLQALQTTAPTCRFKPVERFASSELLCGAALLLRLLGAALAS